MKALFEFITESYSLVENPIEDWVLMGIVGLIAYIVAFNLVGKLYDGHIISGRGAGHVLHWIIRLFVFVGVFYVFAVIIRIYDWFNNLANIKWWIMGGLVVIALFIYGIRQFVLLRKERQRL